MKKKQIKKILKKFSVKINKELKKQLRDSQHIITGSPNTKFIDFRRKRK